MFGNLLLLTPNLLALIAPFVIYVLFSGSTMRSFLAAYYFSGTHPAAPGGPFPPLFFLGIGLAVLAFLLLSIFATAAVFRGAADALAGRSVTLSSLFAGGRKNAGNIVGFYVLAAVLGISVELLLLLLNMFMQDAFGGMLILVPFAACAFFASFYLIYALPAIVVSGMNPGDAMLESANLARDNFGSTLILLVATVALGAAVWGVNAIADYVPILGLVFDPVSTALSAVLGALFSVHFYLMLSGRSGHSGGTETKDESDAPSIP